MTDTLSESEQSAKYGRKVLWVILGFFATFATVDALFVYMAAKTHTGVVSTRAYEVGIKYNDTIKAADAQSDLNWDGSITLVGNRLEYALLGEGGEPIIDATVTAEITRPTQKGLDFKAELQETAAGIYSSNINFPLDGQWDVRVYVEWQSKTYQQSSRILVK